jgi:AhpD family alkylhydroperoxidase
MNHMDVEKIEKMIEDRKSAHKYLVDRKSKPYEAFLKMEKAAYSAGALEKEYKELVAIGISIVIDCESCLEWHLRQALHAGATHDQILEAIEVGMEMGGGPATVTSRFALKVLEYYMKKNETRKHKR